MSSSTQAPSTLVPAAVRDPSSPPSWGRLDATLDRLAAELGGTTARRERDRELLHAPVRELLDAGFGALRIPVAHGGLGGSLADLTERLVRIATVDPNLAHLFRGHIGFVEQLRVAPAGPYVDEWDARIARGILVGNAQSELAATADLGAVVERTPEGLRLSGTKYYTTGSIYSDWILLSARLDGADSTDLDSTDVQLVVDAHHPGVVSVDDWNGFGQPLTGSGTTTFARVPVREEDVFPPAAARDGDPEYVAGVFQLVLLAVIAGIGRAAVDDAIAFVRPRRRIFGFAGEARPAHDPLVQALVGRLSSAADAARRLVLSAARELDDAREATRDAGPEQRVGLLRAAALDVFRVQQVAPTLVLDAATELFEVGGASATDRGLALDRHWRNARTLFSHNPAPQRARAIGEWELNGTWVGWGRTQPAPEPAQAAGRTEVAR